MTEHDSGYDQPGDEDRTVYRQRPAPPPAEQPWPQGPGYQAGQPPYDAQTQAYQRPQVPPPAGPGQTAQGRVPPPPPPGAAPPSAAPGGPAPGAAPGAAAPGTAMPGGAWAGQAGQAAPGAAWPSAAPPPQTDARGFVSSLFDFSFTSFVTPKVVKVLYALIMIGVVLGAVIFVAAAFRVNSFFGLFTLFILAPLYFLVVMAIYRIVLEFFIVMFRISEDIRALRQRGDIR